MAWYPKAIRKVITAKSRSRMRWYRRVNLHVAVSEASSLFGYFNQKGIADSHFYVRKDGTVEQMVDTAYQAYADLQGNDATISIETQGGLTNAQGEKWTAAQVESLAQIYAWAVKTHGIPLKMATNSVPTGTTSHGLSWHRLGIDGNFGGGILSGRVAGGMHYSKARGKVCPGDAKIRQVPDVFARAQQIINGGGSPAPAPAPTPKPQPKDWFTMASAADLRKIVREEIRNTGITIAGKTKAELGVNEVSLAALARYAAASLFEGRDIPGNVWTQEYNIGGATKTAMNRDQMKTIDLLRYAAASAFEGRNQHADLRARVAAIQAAVHELATDKGVDADKIDAAINKAVTDALKDLKITLTTED